MHLSSDEKYGVRKILKNLLYFLVIPFVILVLGYDLYDYLMPLDALVKVKEISPNAHTRFQVGTFTLYYGDTAVTDSIKVGKYVNGIHRKYKKKLVNISFRSDGYVPLDTQVVMDKVITLYIQRDKRLSHLRGMVNDANGMPLDSVRVRIKNSIGFTNDKGYFILNIDSSRQQYTQNIYLSKLGYNSQMITEDLMKGQAEDLRIHATMYKLTAEQKRLLRMKNKEAEAKLKEQNKTK